MIPASPAADGACTAAPGTRDCSLGRGRAGAGSLLATRSQPVSLWRSVQPIHAFNFSAAAENDASATHSIEPCVAPGTESVLSRPRSNGASCSAGYLTRRSTGPVRASRVRGRKMFEGASRVLRPDSPRSPRVRPGPHPTPGSPGLARGGRVSARVRSPITNVALTDRPGLGAGASVGLALAHDSAARHVQGTAAYVDDLPEPAGTVHIAPGHAGAACGAVRSIDLDAVRASPGVLAVLTAADIPGTNDCSPAFGDDPILAGCEILFHGQVVFAVVAETRDEARRAARRARIEVEAGAPRVTVDDGLAAGAEVLAPYEFRRGEPVSAIAAAACRLEGGVRIGGQDHFYLEGQAALAVPGEDDEMRVYSSTQHPSEVQNLVARMLGAAACGGGV